MSKKEQTRNIGKLGIKSQKTLIEESPCLNPDALVMFSDNYNCKPLGFLKTGYRHCFIAIRSHKDWIVYEPLLGRTEITQIKNLSIADVKNCFELMGCRVISTNISRNPSLKSSLFTPFTCVNSIKRVLGLSNILILTPWQLYKFLKSKTQPKEKI